MYGWFDVEVLTSVRDVDDVHDLGDQSRVEEVTQVELRLEVSRTSEDDTLDVDLVIGNEVLNRMLGNLSNVVVPGLHSQTRESKRGLTSSTWKKRNQD